MRARAITKGLIMRIQLAILQPIPSEFREPTKWIIAVGIAI